MTTTKKDNTILVPTDFSEVANNALEHAIAIAKKYGNEILLLHILEESFLGSLFGGKSSVKDGIYGQLLQEKLDKLATEIQQKNNIPTQSIIREGRIYKTIIEVSEEIDCDSIIMGTNGASGMEVIMGSNSSRVISQAKVPVVVVKEKRIGAEGYKSIVLPIDLTQESKQKVKWAIHVAKKFNSTIHVVYEEINDEFLRNKVKANISQVGDVLEKNGVNYTSKELDDKNYPSRKFANDTLQYAEEIDADLIMIMTQQEREDIGEFIIGSYAQQIVNRHSKVPVMCISPRDTGLVTVGWSGF